MEQHNALVADEYEYIGIVEIPRMLTPEQRQKLLKTALGDHEYSSINELSRRLHLELHGDNNVEIAMTPKLTSDGKVALLKENDCADDNPAQCIEDHWIREIENVISLHNDFKMRHLTCSRHNMEA